jgi:hypothetical protein
MAQPTACGPDQFDPATFAVVEPRTFEDLKVGDIFRAPSRTLTDAHATASGSAPVGSSSSSSGGGYGY